MSCATTTTLSRGDTVLATSDTGGAYRRTLRVVPCASCAGCRRRSTRARVASRCRRCPCPNREPVTPSSRCRTAASAAPTCTSCSSSTPRPGSVLGHEWAGTVAAIGAGVDGSVDRRTRRRRDPTPGCGECRACRRGRPVGVPAASRHPTTSAFRGAFCRYVVVPAARLLAIPDALPIRAAALTEPTAIAFHTVEPLGRGARRPRARHRRRPGRAAHDSRCSAPAASTTSPCRAGAAATQRARPTWARRGDRARTTLPRAPMGRRSTSRTRSRSSARATRAAAEAALDQLDYAGTLVFVGTGHELPRVNHNRAIVLELTIIGAYNYDADGFARRARAARVGRACRSTQLIEADDVVLDELLPTMHRLAAGELARQGDGAPERRPRMSSTARPPAATQPRRDHDGSARCSTSRAAPSSSRSTARCSAGPRATTPASPATRSSCTPARSASSSTCFPASRRSRAPALDHFGYQVATLDELARDRRRAPGARPRTTTAVRDHRRARAHDPRSRARLHAHERVHRLRAAAHDRAPAPSPARLTGPPSAGSLSRRASPVRGSSGRRRPGARRRPRCARPPAGRPRAACGTRPARTRAPSRPSRP